MKVLVINCGSSSLKYQLLDMETEKVLCKGLCERIGGEGSCITHQVGGNKMKADAPFPSHTEAFAKLGGRAYEVGGIYTGTVRTAAGEGIGVSA